MSTDNKQSLPALTLAAIGVVYGDIGTSPLYTLRECLSGQFGFGVERDAVFGFLSLIFWLLIFTVSIKYITFVMRADNAGEGGILTLMSLAGRNTSARMTSVLVILGLIGGSFFYGEVVITPAISVMSAIEGLEIIAPQLDTWIVPISIIVLTLLFVIQKHGTGMVGKLFAPIMLIWFLLLAVLGARSIYANPEVLQALNPYWAVHFFLQYKTVSWRGGAVDYRGGSAVRRYGPLRQTADPRRLVLRRAALVGAELFWPGRAAAEAPGSD